METTDAKINSVDYWNNRFVNNWEENAGKLQTLYFYNIALQLFPDWMHEQLNSGVEIADVGCAEGDGVDLFSKKYSNSSFTGIDFSKEAIKKATEQFPENKFIAMDIKDISDKYDITFSSNTLEHFHDPFSKLDYLFKCTKKYVILLLPFQERNRFDEHFYTFEYKDFNLKRNNFELVYACEYDCSKIENIFWSGKQILLIYKHSDLESSHSINLDYFVGDLSESYDDIKQKNKEKENKILELFQINENQKNDNEKLINGNVKLININDQLQNDNSNLIEIIKQNQQIIDELIAKQDNINDLGNLLVEQQSMLTRLKLEKDIEKKTTNEEIMNLKRQEEWFKTENYNLSIDLKNVYQSNFWRMARRYYTFRDKTPIVKHIYKSLKVIKENGFETYLRLLKHKVIKKIKTPQIDPTNRTKIFEVYQLLISRMRNSEVQGLAIIPSAFVFDELYNQRTINLAKYLSSKKIATLFIVWQWERNESLEQAYNEVYPNVYSIPMYAFMDQLDDLSLFNEINEKYAFMNIPSNHYVQIINNLRVNNFCVIYDIMDEWEEFSLVGQAPWYNKIAEESMLLQADKVVAVSQPLVDKFNHLRKDIICVGNGYYKNLIGQANIANKIRNKDQIIHVGYFGHLTESWFDWKLIFDLLVNKNIFLHIIGYGASEETILKLKTYSNVKYYGKVKPNELEKHVKFWHVGIIPFINSDLSQAVDPIKIYEYLYFGLPTVVTGINHLKSMPLVKVCENDSNQFCNTINETYELITDGSYDYIQLSTFLKNSTWEERFNKLLATTDDNVYARLYK